MKNRLNNITIPTCYTVFLYSLYLLILTIFLTDFVSEENNIACCASTTTNVTPQNQTWDQFITELTLQELDVLNDDLGNENPDNTGLANTNRFCWESRGLFIVGTIILFGISQYGDALISLLFNASSNTMNAVTRGVVGLIEFAQETGQVLLLRQFMIERGQELLNDPDTANKVVNGLRRVADFRQLTLYS